MVSSPSILLTLAKESQPAHDAEGGARSVQDIPLASGPPTPEVPPAIPNDSDHEQTHDEGIHEPWIVS